MNVVTKNGTFSPAEIENYKKYLEDKFPNCEIVELKLTGDEVDPEYVNLDYVLKNKTNVPFERIRRITGYLVTMKRANNAKTAEIHDRVKHGTVDTEGGY
jgi:anaerobic ribonucleoside-triphosphate reductase